MKPLILITNDDGVYSPGLKAAAEAVSDFADLVISAPISQQTGMGRSFPRTKDLGIIETIPLEINEQRRDAYGVHGSPAYAAAHGILELSPRKPDLCISGINYGENLGMVLTCSGTLGAAMEASSHGIAAIAVSTQIALSSHHATDYPEYPWEIPKETVRSWAQRILAEGMPEGVDILNINIPGDVKSAEDYKITRQSRQNYFELIRPGARDFTRPLELQSRILVDEDSLDRKSDIYAFQIEQKISVTPLKMDMSAEI